jgi:thymidylate synthase (FAD)
MTIKIINITKNPLSLMGEVASTCWGSNPKDLKKVGIECIESGHHRVMEYPDMIISIEGYSARMIRELYTHVVGTTRLQESTRYIDCSSFDYYIPESIKTNPNAIAIYYRVMGEITQSYEELQELDIPKQDVANILPLGMTSKIVLKINLRALLHMAELRLCKRALQEFQDFMKELKLSLIHQDEEWFHIMFNYYKPKCKIVGYCTEKFSCGMMQMKEKVLNS